MQGGTCTRTRPRGVAPGWHAPRRWRVNVAEFSIGENCYGPIHETGSSRKMYLFLSDDSERQTLTMGNDSHKSRAGTMFRARRKTMKLKPGWEMGTLPGALPRAGMLRAVGASTWLSSQSEKTATDRFMRQARARKCIFPSPTI